MARLESSGSIPSQRSAATVVPTHSRAAAKAPVRHWSAALTMVVLFVAGGVLAHRLAAVDVSGGDALSLGQVNTKLTFAGNGWVTTLTWFGGFIGILSAIVFPRSERFIRAVATTGGGLVAMALPLFVQTHLSNVDDAATSLGSGLRLAWVCFAIAAVIPWISLLWWDRADPVLGRDWAKWLFMLPAVFWVLLMTVFPLLFAFTTSRYSFRAGGRIGGYVGWKNYQRLFDIPSPARAFGTALLWAAIAAVAILTVSLLFGLLANREVSRGDLRRGAGLIPLAAVPAAMVYLARTIFKDPIGTQLNITFFFVAVAVLTELLLGFLIALLMNRELRGRGVLRAVMTLPLFATPIALGYLGRVVFHEERGPVNTALAGVHLGQPPWLSDPSWARIATILVDVWQWTPFVFIIALAALQGLPQDVIEASQVDGASSWQVLRYVTLPMMAPILWLIFLLRSIDAFKVLDIAQGLTGGGPGGRATEYFSLYNFKTARIKFDYGGAAAQAFLLLFIVMLLVSLLWGRIRHVYEEEGGRP
jgi:multiple sugar transport system permease protein